MYDWLWQIQWDQMAGYLTSGQPSLLMQLVALNALILTAIIVLRMRRDPHAKRRPSFYIQEVLLALNLFILSEDQFRPFYYSHIEPIVYNFRHWVL